MQQNPVIQEGHGPVDASANKLYVADSLQLKYPAFYEEFAELVTSTGIDVNILPDTKDIWAVDYMPL